MASDSRDLALIVKLHDQISGPLKDIADHTEHIGVKAGITAAVFTKAIDLMVDAAQALVGQVGKAISSAGDLEQAVANISTIKPEIDTSGVFYALNEMQTRVPQTAAQLGDALYNVFSSVSVSTEEALQLVETFARGAVGASTDAQTFGTAVMGVMNAYGLAVEDAEHISDIFFNTVNAGVITGQELAASLGPVTQSAKLAGVSIEELGGFIAGVTKEGGPAAQNINNLNNLFMKISTTEAQKALHDMGIATTDATGKFRPMVDVFTDLKAKLENLTEAEKINALQEIFPDAQARAGAAVILSQIEFVKEAIRTNIEATGAAREAYEKMSATFNSQTDLLKNAWNSILTAFGANVLPLLTPIITAFGQSLPAAFKELEARLAPVGAALSTLKLTIKSLAEDNGITGFVGVLQGISITLNEVFGPSTARLFDVITQKVSDLAQALGGLFSGGDSSDFTGFIETISGAILSLFDTVGGASDVFSVFVDTVGTMLGGLAGIVQELVEGDIRGAFAVLNTVVSDVLGSISSALVEFGPSLGESVAGWASVFLDGIETIRNDAIAGFLSLVGTVYDTIIASGPQLAEAFLGSWVPAMIGWILGTALPEMIGQFFSMVGTVADWLASGGAEQIITASVVMGVAVGVGIYQGLANLQTQIIAWVGEKISQATAALQGVAEQGGRDVGSNMVQGVVNGIGAGIGAIGAAMQRIVNAGLAAANVAGEGHSPYEKYALEIGEIGMIGGIVWGIERSEKQVFDVMSGFIKELGSNTANFAAEFEKSGAGLASALAKGITDSTPANGAAIAKALDTVVTNLRTAGVENWRELGDELADAVHDALLEGTPEAQAAALYLIGQASEVIREANSPAGVWRRNLHDLTNLAELQAALGVEGAKAGQAFLDAVTSQAPKDVDALFKAVQSLVAKAQEKGIPLAIEMGQRLQELIGEAFSNLANPERLAEISAEINEIIGTIGTQLDELKNKVVTPVEAAMKAAADAVRDSALVEEFGLTGAKAVTAIEQAFGDARMATAAVNGIQKMVDEAVKKGVEGAAEIGAAIQDNLILYLETHDEAYLAEARRGVGVLWRGMQDADHATEAAKLAEKMAKSLESAFESTGDSIRKAVAKHMSLADALKLVFDEADAAAAAAISSLTADTVKNLGQAGTAFLAQVERWLPPDHAARVANEFWNRWQAVNRERTPEAIADLNALEQGYRTFFVNLQATMQAGITATAGLTAEQIKATAAAFAGVPAYAALAKEIGTVKDQSDAATEATKRLIEQLHTVQNLPTPSPPSLPPETGPVMPPGVVNPPGSTLPPGEAPVLHQHPSYIIQQPSGDHIPTGSSVTHQHAAPNGPGHTHDESQLGPAGGSIAVVGGGGGPPPNAILGSAAMTAAYLAPGYGQYIASHLDAASSMMPYTSAIVGAASGLGGPSLSQVIGELIQIVAGGLNNPDLVRLMASLEGLPSFDTWNQSVLSGLPGFAKGGLALGSNPMLAMLHPPEMVVPLGPTANGGGLVNYELLADAIIRGLERRPLQAEISDRHLAQWIADQNRTGRFS